MTLTWITQHSLMTLVHTSILHCLVTRVDTCVLTDGDQEGVMDNLLEALKTGSAFNVNRERKEGRRRTPRAAGGRGIFNKIQ